MMACVWHKGPSYAGPVSFVSNYNHWPKGIGRETNGLAGVKMDDDLSSDEEETLSRSPRPYHSIPYHAMPVCVSATVHTPARRGGCTDSDPGLTRGTDGDSDPCL